MIHRLVAQIRYKDISYGICDRQSGTGADLCASTAVVIGQYHVTVILCHWLYNPRYSHNDGKYNKFFPSFYISLSLCHKATLTSPLLSASNHQHNATLSEGRIQLITFGSCPTHFNKYLCIYTQLHLGMRGWGYGAVRVKGKVICWWTQGALLV